MNRKALVKAALYVLLGLGAVSMLLPFVWMAFTSIKQPGEVFAAGGAIKLLPGIVSGETQS